MSCELTGKHVVVSLQNKNVIEVCIGGYFIN